MDKFSDNCLNFFEIYLKNSIDINAKFYCGHTLLTYAVQRFCNDLVKILLQDSRLLINEPGTQKLATPVYVAVDAGNEEALKMLLENPSIDVNKPSLSGFAPIHLAASYMARPNLNGNKEKNSVSLETRKNILQQLLNFPEVDVLMATQDERNASCVNFSLPSEYFPYSFELFILIQTYFKNKYVQKAAEIFSIFGVNFSTINTNFDENNKPYVSIEVSQVSTECYILKMLKKYEILINKIKIQYILNEYSNVDVESDLIGVLRLSDDLSCLSVDLYEFEYFCQYLQHNLPKCLVTKKPFSTLFNGDDFYKAYLLPNESSLALARVDSN